MKRAIYLLFFLALLIVSCAPTTPTAQASITPGSSQNTPAGTVSSVPLYKDPTQPVEARVEDLLSRMTLEEKIGQMTQGASHITRPKDVSTYFLGSVLSGGDGLGNNTLAEWTAFVRQYQEQALATRLGIPILFGVDSVHGFGHVNGATIFPHNIGLGATRDPDLVRQIGRAVAVEMRAAGIHWNFAPVIAVPQDIRWGRTYEGFSEDTAVVTELGAAYIEGFQSLPPDYAATPGQTLYALATAKHYIGDGGTVWGSSRQVIDSRYMLDQGNMQVDEATVRRLFLPPYQKAVDVGVMSVMASFSSWRGVKLHGHRYLLTNVLKDELGFPGFIVSDWSGIYQVDEHDPYKAIVASINAGIDMDMEANNVENFIRIVKRAVEAGDIPQERIDDAVRRILRVKFLLGLFENPYGDPSLAPMVNSEAHRALAQQAVRESLVLLKNDNNALPVDKNVSTILVAGINSTGIQAGGWTLEWQGVSDNRLIGTTILDGIRSLVGPDTQVLYNNSGRFENFTGTAPVGIAIVGEMPYAEGKGDKADLSLSETDIAVINNLRPRVDKLIVIILSGRPLVITDQYQTADAWVAAWLPGSEGAAVADVLFGDYPFTGKLPYTWPRSNDQLPINEYNSSGKTGCEAPLFPFGYGLGEAGSAPIEWIECP